MVALPARLRSTTLYRVMVEVTLRFLIDQMGQVKGIYVSEEGLARNFLLKRGASHGIEWLGILTLHFSPVWILAALADLTGAGHELIQQIAQGLKKEGLLDDSSEFRTADELLDGLERTSAQLARTLNLPPVGMTELRAEWSKIKAALPTLSTPTLPSVERLHGIWEDLVRSAEAQDRPVFIVCSTIAVNSLAEIPSNMLWLSRALRVGAKTTGGILGEVLLDHYQSALDEITRVGFLTYWRRGFRPYLRAAAEQFAPETESSTERLLNRGDGPKN